MADLDCETTERKPRVFLSSTYGESNGTELRYFGIRQQLYDLGDELRIPIWVHECIKRNGLAHAFEQNCKPDWIAAVEECLEELSRSDLVIVLLGSRAGVRIEMGEAGQTAASVLEVELYYANLKRIPVVFYVLRGYEPEPELSNLIEILDLKGNKNWFEVDEEDVCSEVKALLTSFPVASTEEWKLRFFHDRLAGERSFSSVSQEIFSHRLSFLGRFVPCGKADYQPERFKKLINLSEGAVVHRASQLGFLWMALRELSVGGWHPERTDEWLRICDLWPSTAAWTGMHGTMVTSVLAAFHTRNDLLLRQGRSPETDSDFPYGPMASELYSMGLICETQQWKRRRFEAAVKLATRHADRSPRKPDGALGIRASAHLRLARLSRPWHVYSALADYRSAYRFREQNGDSASAVGEALSEWAFAEFQLRHLIHFPINTALNKMREGVRLLESDPAAHRVGFRIRGKRKLAQALSQAGRHDEADVEQREAEKLARSHGILGQLERKP
jgi:hypothetical protein